MLGNQVTHGPRTRTGTQSKLKQSEGVKACAKIIAQDKGDQALGSEDTHTDEESTLKQSEGVRGADEECFVKLGGGHIEECCAGN